MVKPMITLQTSLNFSQTLYKVLEFHLPERASIIDPTPGEKHSWKYYLTERKKPSLIPLKEFNIIFIEDDILSFDKTIKYVEEEGKVDSIFFDPPYIFGKEGTGCDWGDVRREDYGEYYYSVEEVEAFFEEADIKFPKLLKNNGMLFLKYTDVYSVKDRKFFFCAARWPNVLSNFKVVDHYIIPHHHISPTAWQVKNRPCGIVNYTYLTAFRKEDKIEN